MIMMSQGFLADEGFCERGLIAFRIVVKTIFVDLRLRVVSSYRGFRSPQQETVVPHTISVGRVYSLVSSPTMYSVALLRPRTP